MTKKSLARLRRHRAALANNRASGGRDPDSSSASPHTESRSTSEIRIGQPVDAWIVAGDGNVDHGDSKPAQRQERRTSARCAILAAAFHSATNGAVRRQLKDGAALALIIFVPGASWIDGLSSLFIARFGKRWKLLPTDAPKLSQKSQRNNDTASYLSRGEPVIAVAVDRTTLPSTLIAAADITISITAPSGVTIGRAIRMFTGKPVPNSLDKNIAAGLEFHDIVAAFRAHSSPAEIVDRLKRASPAASDEASSERLPSLQDAVEYGPARDWGLALARDLTDYRAGCIGWRDVDRGAVLHSEPGLGKSLFARILARACGVPLVDYSIADLFANSPGDLDSVIKASRQMFGRAAAVAPCILFLDEIDALPNRATMSPRGADWWTSVITDFLLSLDNAIAGKRSGIVVIAATNNIKGVDAAILRPGRLERAIEISRPDYCGTINILRHHVDGALSEADIAEAAHLLEGSTGAEIMMAVRGARRIARYAGCPLDRDHLLQAIAPPEDIPSPTLDRTCFHEAAHAVAALVVNSGVVKRCVVSGSLGAAGHTVIWTDPYEIATRDSIERRVTVMLCGRAAEQHFMGDISIGSGGGDDSDLAWATRLVTTLHASTGLGGSLIYLTSHQDALSAVRRDHDLRATVERHLTALQIRANELVVRHRDAIIAVADQLRIQRQVSGEEIRRIVETTALNG
ncbi:MAG: ATP-binding protein [Xanthobacteraceae bacterium]